MKEGAKVLRSLYIMIWVEVKQGLLVKTFLQPWSRRTAHNKRTSAVSVFNSEDHSPFSSQPRAHMTTNTSLDVVSQTKSRHMPVVRASSTEAV